MSYLDMKWKDNLYVVFRVGIGALFFMFGIMKLFGLWGMPGGAVSFGTQIWFAGAGELLIGLGLIVGVLTRLASVFGVIEMTVAYIIGHAMTGGWNPAVNQGIPALLFMLAFLVTLAYGSGRYSLEKTLLGRELF